MFCALSGTPATEPVVNKKTGHVYEKRLIEKWIEANGNKDPSNPDQELTLEDLLALKNVNKVVPPRPTTATSIPSMLQLFQNEWDAVMLETYTLKQQLENVRQELAHALYQHDAACRVIARLIKERDDARNSLASLKASGATISAQQGESKEAEAMEVEGANLLTEEIKSKITARSQELAKDRKKRQVPENLPTADQVKSFDVLGTFPLHKTTKPGITCVDVHPQRSELIMTGGVDGSVLLFNRNEKKIVSTMSDHKSKITDVMFHPEQDMFFSTSSDKTAKIWTPSSSSSSSYQCAHTINVHNDEVIGCTLQATGDYWVTGSKDGSWAFHDIESGTALSHITSETPLTSVSFHPDGVILGTGINNGAIKIWDIKALKNVATFEGHKGNLVSMSFSENGYYLATAAEDNVLKLWDLRKLKNVQSIHLGDDYGVTHVEFDYSGTYLAVSGSSADVRVYLGKSFNHIATFSKKHKDTITDVHWGSHDSTSLVTVSLDRHLKLWGIK